MKIKIKVGSSALVQQSSLQHEAFAHISDEATRLVDDGHPVSITTSGFAAAAGSKSQEAYAAGEALIEAEWQRRLGDKFGGLQLVECASLSKSIKRVQAELAEDRIALTNGQFGDQCFGGNDHLAVAIARGLSMDRVVLLGDMTGIRRDVKDADSVLSRIELDRIEDYQQFVGAVSLSGTGGIEAKFAAAQDAADSGIITHYGHWQSHFDDLLSGEVGTTFLAAGQELGVVV